MALDPLLLGLALGARHALEPDHLAAVTTFVTRTSDVPGAARMGAAWGLGHGLAIALFGGAVIATGVRVPGPIAVALDLAVAVVLVWLGVRALRRPDHASPADEAHAHAHGARSAGRSTMIGFVHGASGTAAITVLCLSTFHSTRLAVGFLALFALGALASMAALSGLLASPLSALARRGRNVARAVRWTSGLLALAAAALVLVTVLREQVSG
ncbi:MAG: hypothetical protein NVS3B10_17810 [Polyangiales bacterium]